MSVTDRFFSETKQAQAELKHAILRRYLATFAGATGATSLDHRVGYLDGYAGPGEYVSEGSGIRREGSPRIALDIAADQLRVPRNLEAIFIEKDAQHFQQLEQLTSSAPTKATAIRGDVRDELESALQQFDGIPALVFLDPFGQSVGIDLVQQVILQRSPDVPTELLLNFSLQAVRRMGARLWETTESAGRTTTLESMDSWLGGDWWRQHFLDPDLEDDAERADKAAMNVAHEYVRRICAATGCGAFCVEIRRKPRQKPLFLLMLFFPRSLAAFKYNEAVSIALSKWREAMWDLDIQEAEADGDRAAASELRTVKEAAARQFDHDAVEDIKAAIRAALMESESLAVHKDFRRIFGKAAGLGREMHLRKAWDELAKEGIVAERDKKLKKLDRAEIKRPPSRFGGSF